MMSDSKLFRKNSSLWAFAALVILALPFQITLENIYAHKSFLISVTLILALVFLLRHYFILTYEYWHRLGVPYIPAKPLVGHTLRRLGITVHFKEFYEDAYYNYNGNDMCGLYEGSTPSLMIGNLDAVKSIYIEDFGHFAQRMTFDMSKISAVISGMVPFLVGERWQSMRHNLSPIFTRSKLSLLVPLISEQTDALVKLIHRMGLNKEIKAKEVCDRYNMDNIASCAFGIESNSMQNLKSEFSEMAKRMFIVDANRALKLTILMVSNKLGNLMEGLGGNFVSSEFDFFVTVAKRTLNLRKERDFYRGDFLDFMKEQGLTEDEMISQAVLFLLAGFGNTSSCMSFILHSLAVHPQIQEKLRKEIFETGFCDAQNKEIYEIVSKMPYLEAIFKETLRLYPGSPDVQRQCIKDYQVPGTKLVIRKGQSILVPIYCIHRDPQYWDEPEKFEPERFLSNYKKSAYLPFGLGPRTCLGMKFGTLAVKLGICKILSHFEVVPSAINTIDPPPLRRSSFALQPANMIPLVFRQLDANQQSLA